MKNLRKFLFALGAFAAILTFASCSDNDDDGNSGGVSITLPESVGTNELVGTKWESSDYGYSYTFEFADGTATYTEVYSSEIDEIDKRVYNYTYDSENKLIYLAPITISYSDEEGEYSYSASTFESLAKKYGLSGDDFSRVIEVINNMFSTKTVYKYTLDGNSLTLEEYFDGSLPSNVTFNYTGTDLDGIYEGYLSLYVSSYYYEIIPIFSNGTFSGNLYKYSNDDDTEKLGKASGTYTISGKGTSRCTISFTFTSLPEGFSVISKDKEYKFKQYKDPRIYTKTTN